MWPDIIYFCSLVCISFNTSGIREARLTFSNGSFIMIYRHPVSPQRSTASIPPFGCVLLGYTSPVQPAQLLSPIRILYSPLINAVSVNRMSTHGDVEFSPEISGHILRLSIGGRLAYSACLSVGSTPARAQSVAYQSAMWIYPSVF